MHANPRLIKWTFVNIPCMQYVCFQIISIRWICLVDTALAKRRILAAGPQEKKKSDQLFPKSNAHTPTMNT